MFWLIGSIVVVIVFFLLLLAVLERKSSAKSREKATALMEKRGEQGEHDVTAYLRMLLQDGECLLTHLLIPLRNGRKTEIDAVLITKRGIFCIEIKNWVGHISGDEFGEDWIQEYDDFARPTRKHKNPVLQNQKHCEVLEEILQENYDVKNIVLFWKIEDRTNLFSSSTFDVASFIPCFQKLPSGKLYEGEIEEIARKLSGYQASKEEMEDFKEQMKRIYRP